MADKCRVCLGKGIRKLVHACEGVAIIDFALVAPILAFMLMGGVETGRFMLLNEKLNAVASKSGDLVSRVDVAREDDIQQVFVAAGYGLRPFEMDDDGVIIITSVATQNTNPAEVMWQTSGGGTGSMQSKVGIPGEVADLPPGLTMVDNQNYIIAEVFFDYTPILFDGVIAPKQLYFTATYRPRVGALLDLEPATVP